MKYAVRCEIYGRLQARQLWAAMLVLLLTGSVRMRLNVDQEPRLVGGGR